MEMFQCLCMPMNVWLTTTWTCCCWLVRGSWGVSQKAVAEGKRTGASVRHLLAYQSLLSEGEGLPSDKTCLLKCHRTLMKNPSACYTVHWLFWWSCVFIRLWWLLWSFSVFLLNLLYSKKCNNNQTYFCFYFPLPPLSAWCRGPLGMDMPPGQVTLLPRFSPHPGLQPHGHQGIHSALWSMWIMFRSILNISNYNILATFIIPLVLKSITSLTSLTHEISFKIWKYIETFFCQKSQPFFLVITVTYKH